jgi:hypothetical protein
MIVDSGVEEHSQVKKNEEGRENFPIYIEFAVVPTKQRAALPPPFFTRFIRCMANFLL